MKLAALLLAGLAVAACDAAPAVAPAAASAQITYGTVPAKAETVAIAALIANPANYEGRVVQVEGTVTDVCATRGCWIKIGPETGPDTVFFKVDDGVMTFPMSAKGSPVTAYGTVRSVKTEKGQVVAKLEGTGAVVGR